jgi:excisionase family DNA binding protein
VKGTVRVKRSTAPADDRHLTIDELSARLQIPVQTIYVWNYTGKGPKYLKVGRHIRYRVADVEAWEKTRVVDRTGPWL